MPRLNKEQRNEYQRRRRDKRKDLLIQRFEDECHDCKKKFHKCAYDFHHIDPNIKSFEIAPALDRNWNTILEEIEKCIMLCSNCHRIRHYREERGSTEFDSLLV